MNGSDLGEAPDDAENDDISARTAALVERQTRQIMRTSLQSELKARLKRSGPNARVALWDINSGIVGGAMAAVVYTLWSVANPAVTKEQLRDLIMKMADALLDLIDEPPGAAIKALIEGTGRKHSRTRH